MSIITRDMLTEIDPVREDMYDQLRKNGAALKIPTPEAFLKFELVNRAGEIYESRLQRSNSYVRNFYNFLMSSVSGMLGSTKVDTLDFGGGSLKMKDTLGTIYTGMASAPWYVTTPSGSAAAAAGYWGAAGDSSMGIIVGRGDNAEDFEHYMLVTPVVNGTGENQVSYALQEPTVLTYDGTTKIHTATMVRYFNNNSAADITINEVGIVWAFYNTSGAGKKFLMVRDRLTTPLEVLVGGQLRVTYTEQITYPA